MPTLRGFSVSCKNVDDGALSLLPELPSLAEFMPIDVPDNGFRHVGRCERLEAVRCMYCRDTGDAATAYLATLPRLKTYYAGLTQITDRSLEILSGIETLGRVILSACPALTNAGIAKLASLPRPRCAAFDSRGRPRDFRDVRPDRLRPAPKRIWRAVSLVRLRQRPGVAPWFSSQNLGRT